jgi:hypothetical protein
MDNLSVAIALECEAKSQPNLPGAFGNMTETQEIYFCEIFNSHNLTKIKKNCQIFIHGSNMNPKI